MLPILSFSLPLFPPRSQTIASGHKNGYVKIKVHGRKARNEFYLQQLVMVAKGVTNLADIGHGSTHECSHICHEVACFNPDHIVIEPTQVNKSRNKCVKLTCLCGQVVTNCTHQPACIL